MLYVLDGTGTRDHRRRRARARAGRRLFVARGTRRGRSRPTTALELLSVLVHDPEPAADGAHARRRSRAEQRRRDRGPAVHARASTPDVGCASVTQFIGFVPPGRAPDHFHRYDEVLYVLEGEGALHIGGEDGAARARLVRPPAGAARPLPREHRRRRAAAPRRLPAAGSPAEAYYPDGTPAVYPSDGGLTCRRIERTAEIVWEGNLARGDGPISAGTGAFTGLALLDADPDRAARGQDEPRGAARGGARRLLHDVARRRADELGHPPGGSRSLPDRDGRGRGPGAPDRRLAGGGRVAGADLDEASSRRPSSSPTRAARSRHCSSARARRSRSPPSGSDADVGSRRERDQLAGVRRAARARRLERLACSSATTGSGARSRRLRSPSRASTTTSSPPGTRSGSAGGACAPG